MKGKILETLIWGIITLGYLILVINFFVSYFSMDFDGFIVNSLILIGITSICVFFLIILIMINSIWNNGKDNK